MKTMTDEFMLWWEKTGCLTRSGGGDYERTFAFEAWRTQATRITELEAQLADAKKDAERYQWLCDKGYSYHGAMAGTGSMSICRGPYIILEPPSHNNFSKMVLGKLATDVIIDAAISKESQLKALTELVQEGQELGDYSAIQAEGKQA